jgi:hypothetical protein
MILEVASGRDAGIIRRMLKAKYPSASLRTEKIDIYRVTPDGFRHPDIVYRVWAEIPDKYELETSV